jgi:hypothetical protein
VNGVERLVTPLRRLLQLAEVGSEFLDDASVPIPVHTGQFLDGVPRSLPNRVQRVRVIAVNQRFDVGQILLDLLQDLAIERQTFKTTGQRRHLGFEMREPFGRLRRSTDLI